MDPNCIAVLVVEDYLLRKSFVHLDVVAPRMVKILLTFWLTGELVVQDRPQDCFAVMTVASTEVGISDENSEGVVFVFELVLDTDLGAVV